jgi:hypothetical protein
LEKDLSGFKKLIISTKVNLFGLHYKFLYATLGEGVRRGNIDCFLGSKLDRWRRSSWGGQGKNAVSRSGGEIARYPG